MAPSPQRDPKRPPSADGVDRRHLLVFCLSVAVLYGIGAGWGLPSILNPASDSPVPLSSLNWIVRYRDTSISNIYPPVHQLLCLAAYGVVLLGWKAVGAIGSISTAYPYGFRNPTHVFSSFLLATNLLSVAMGVGILVCLRFFRLGRTFGAWYGVALLALSGVLSYHARVGNLDVPYLFWAALSWVFVWQHLFRGGGMRSLVFAAIAGALAMGSKDQAIGIEAGLGLTLLLLSSAQGGAALRDRIKAAFLFGGAMFVAYCATSIAVNPWRWWSHVSYVSVIHGYPEYGPTLLGQLQLLARGLLRLSHMLSPGGLILGAVGSVFLARNRSRETAALLIPPFAYYVLIIVQCRTTEERYMLPIALALAVAAGVAAGELLHWSRSRRFARYAAIAALAAVAVDQFAEGFYPVTYCQVVDLRRQVARDLPSLVPAGSPLLMIQMSSFNIPNSRTYGRYRLMLPPDKTLSPPSAHGEHVLAPYDSRYRYVLAGSTLTDETWPPVGNLVREWVYPQWIKSRVQVPAIHEFALYERGE